MSKLYDRIGASYRGSRRSDPRIATVIVDALGDARSVVNVGAGTGAYEPPDLEVLAVEPSATMIEQRPKGSAAAIQASAEGLPLPDDSFDAALAVNTVQHWTDLPAGLRELRRVARRRIVISLRQVILDQPEWDPTARVPELDPSRRMSAVLASIAEELRPLEVIRFELPRDCFDGVFTAFWGRPEMYLDEEIRRNISNFALAAQDDVASGIARLNADLESGAWDRKYGHLRSLPQLDLGHRILISELA